LQEVYDHVNWTKLMQILKGTGIDWSKRRLFSRLYVDQSVKLRLDQGEKRIVKVEEDVMFFALCVVI
jgi:hypothetical protein